jgi:CRISPR-associated protein Csb2
VTWLSIAVSFFDDRYHGLLDRHGPPEWPPSPFRLFQALLAGIARQGSLVTGEDTLDYPNYTAAGAALDWLQRQPPPLIVAPATRAGQKIVRYVPNNDADAPGKLDRQTRLTAKPAIPTLFLADKGTRPKLHYLWPLENAPGCPIQPLREAARSLTALGLGVDMAFADASILTADEASNLTGIRWRPEPGDAEFEETLRVPEARAGDQNTLADLRRCHHSSANRLQPGQPLRMVDRPTIFKRILYTGPDRPPRRPTAVFRLTDDAGEPRRYPHANLVHIAGMARHLAILAAIDLGWPDEEVNHLVRGMRDPAAPRHEQFSYLPLPSIGHEHADAAVRNVMIAAPLGKKEKIEELAERLNGMSLEPLPTSQFKEFGCAPPQLERFEPTPRHFIRRSYLAKSTLWRTVTPVILDGHSRKAKNDKPEEVARATEALLRKALARAGVGATCTFTWQAEPFLKNCLSAYTHDRAGRPIGYLRPKHLSGRTSVHVELRFDNPVCGPLAIGAGRHCGLGLFAAQELPPCKPLPAARAKP